MDTDIARLRRSGLTKAGPSNIGQIDRGTSMHVPGEVDIMLNVEKQMPVTYQCLIFVPSRFRALTSSTNTEYLKLMISTLCSL